MRAENVIEFIAEFILFCFFQKPTVQLLANFYCAFSRFQTYCTEYIHE